jgi:hypothetical protein
MLPDPAPAQILWVAEAPRRMTRLGVPPLPFGVGGRGTHGRGGQG